MADITLEAEPGRETGSSASRRLRSSGRIPGVVYGHGMEGISVSVDARELRHALSGKSGSNQLLDLQIGSDHHLAMARILQRHPVRNTVVHVDFQVVGRDEVISADVPIVLVGEAKSVTSEGGIVEQPLTTLTVNATPGRIPSSIEIDLSQLTVGNSVRVGDLELPAGVTTDLPDDEMVVVASMSRVEGDLAVADAEGTGQESGAAGGEGASGESAPSGDGSEAGDEG